MDKVEDILILNCNLSLKNFSSSLLLPVLSKFLSKSGIDQTLLWQELDLPLFRQDKIDSLLKDEGVKKVIEQIERHGNIIIISPEYHGFCSSVLKNLFEYLSVEKEKKKICLGIITAGGEFGGSTAMFQLSYICQKLKWIFFPENIILNSLKENYTLDQIKIDRIERILTNFLSFLSLIRNN